MQRISPDHDSWYAVPPCDDSGSEPNQDMHIWNLARLVPHFENRSPPGTS